MKAFSIQSVLVMAVVAGGACTAHATITRLTSGVDAYFGSQGTGYQDADPSSLLPFTPPATGPLYPAGSPLPNVPSVVTPLGGNPFQGTPWISTFNDGLPPAALAAAGSKITDNFNSGGTLVEDVSIAIPYWRLEQGPSASAYAYEQLDFYATYGVYSPPAPLAGSAANIPLFIFGNVVTGGNVQFDAQVTYTWYDTTSDGAIIPGSQVTLGTLSCQWSQLGGGSFSLPLSFAGTLLPAPSTAGRLDLTGYAWIAGDPFEITIVPEPASLSLLALGSLALLRRRRQ
jgi:hypothetical protein